MRADLSSLKRELDDGTERSSKPTLVVPAASDSSGRERIKTAGGAAASIGDVAGIRPTASAEYIVGEVRRHKLGVSLLVVTLIAAAAGIVYLSPAGAGQREIDSMAVLPFANVGADPEMEYLSDGITESLINSMSRLPGLRVMSRNSVFRYKGQETDTQKVVNELKVQALLMGRVVQRGDDLIIHAELVNAQDNAHIWGEQYSRNPSDILAVQKEISRDISERLRQRLTGEEKKRLTTRQTDNAEAYRLYLKGRYCWNKRSVDWVKKGIEFFNRAIEEDPTYALAYAGIADSYLVLSRIGGLPPKDAIPKAKAAAMRALEIDDTLAEAYVALASAKFEYDWDFAGAGRDYKRAIELNPNYATAHHWYAMNLAGIGKQDEALSHIKRAQELDPLSLAISADVGLVHYYARRYDQAVEQFQKTLEMDANLDRARFDLGMTHLQRGTAEQAIRELERAVDLSARRPSRLSALGYAYAVSGKRDEAQKILDELNKRSTQSLTLAFDKALIYTAFGEKDEAFEWLDKAYNERQLRIAHLKVNPMLDTLRSDPRYADLLRRVGFPP